jgi:hypothetical protein
MDREELKRLLRQLPLQPFRIILHDGRTFDIKYTGMNLLAESFIKIGIPDETGPEPLCDHTEYVRLDEIARTELLPAAPPSAS